MSDILNLPAKQNESRHFGNVVYTAPDDKVIFSADSCEIAKYVVHAINNHDRLEQEVAELRKENEILEPLVVEKQNLISSLMGESAELKEALQSLFSRGVEINNIDEIEDQEDAFTVQCNFNDALIKVGQLLNK